MSFEMFVRLLQSLITMADSPENVEKAFKILDEIRHTSLVQEKKIFV